ncbi:hypothetical protein BASA81_004066 [Batrachochytrium salamandrivorans]|nr:hypothetical protein BASA81_004066 [Batrachochytrium salamandrivorans]
MSVEEEEMSEEEEEEESLEEENQVRAGGGGRAPTRPQPSNKPLSAEALKKEAILIKRLTKAVGQQAKLAKKHETQKLIKEIKLCKERRSSLQVAGGEPASPLLEKLAGFKGLQKAALELKERPGGSASEPKRERVKRKQLAIKEKKKLQRLQFEIQCTMCTARFGTEETRQLHMEKRHGTTGNAVLDKKLGLQPKRINRPGQRERRTVAQEVEKDLEEASAKVGGKRNKLHPSWEAKRVKTAAASAGLRARPKRLKMTTSNFIKRA